MPKPTTRSHRIAYARIFPSIGIARVGDSEDDFFYGPEFLPAAEGRSTDDLYRDGQGRIKRQAARFRVYGFDAQGHVVRELTASEATITWTVHLANKKAAWFEFGGTAKARQQFANSKEAEKHALRNPQIGAIRRNKVTRRFESDTKRVALEIDGGSKSIEGAHQTPEPGEAGDRYRFKGMFKRGLNGFSGHEVYLGEVRTDAHGRLVVLGGRGISGPVGPNGPVTGDDRLAYWIVNYANNNHWYDDTSDGPVTARVVLKSGAEIRMDGGAWIIVAPPDFAPDIANLVTMYDVIEEVAIAARLKQRPGCPPLRDSDSVSFHQDIEPILRRLNDYRWVSPLGLRGHGHGKPGEVSGDIFTPDSKNTDATTQARVREARERFFRVLRLPTYKALDPKTGKEAIVDPTLAVAQANSYFMPPLSGDEGDRRPGTPERWFSLTRLQYARMEKWKDGDFTFHPDNKRIGKPTLHEEPARLTRCALEACAGGAFFPGIEITGIARDPSLYAEPFRVDHARVGAGDITKYMACPWQADFYECRDAWWPAQRPDAVITELTFEELFKSFEAEKQSGFEAVMFGRERWDRGLEKKPRPSRSYLMDQLLPEPDTKSAREYAESIAENATDLLFSLSPAREYVRYANERLPSGTTAERMPNPWRLQYVTQEQLDGYSGRYFLPAVPSPDEALNVRDVPKEFGSLPPASTLSDVRRNWATFRMTHPSFAGYLVGTYAAAMRSRLNEYLLEVVMQTPGPKGVGNHLRQSTPALQVRHNLEQATDDPSSEPADFLDGSEEYRRLRGGEFVNQLVSRLFLDRAEQAPDMSMVDNWRHLGFVRRRVIKADSAKSQPELIIQIETERDKYDGKSFRDYFYYLMNVEEFPDFIPYARILVNRFLAAAQDLIDKASIFDPDHPESFVPYTPENFVAKMEQIYELLRSQADAQQQYVYRRTRGEQIRRLLARAPFNQTDGAWLRYAANAGTMGEVTSLLFEVWSDEVGNGDASLHHGNLYTALLRSVGLYLPELSSRAYADDLRMDEAAYVAPVFQLAISQYSQDFFPELLGMTLFLEWEVLSLVPGVKQLDYFGIDSQFWRMHVGIDNATHGHGAKARRAVELYLDQVFRESGSEAQQEHWKRVWRGFVAFGTAGYDLFTNVGTTIVDAMSIEEEQRRHAQTPADTVADIMARKLHYGSLNHLRKRLGLYRINDLFDDPGLFLSELANSPWINPGNPDDSKFLSYLTTFNGPMYKVFSVADLTAWREWIMWLGEEGDTRRPKRHITKGEAMMTLLVEMRQLMISTHGHELYRVPEADGRDKGQITLGELFRFKSPKDIMRTLKRQNTGWVVPYRPANSALVVDLMRPSRDMGAALDRRIPALFGETGRMIAYEWIGAGCPVPDEPIPDASRVIAPVRRPRRLFMQQYGTLGAVH